MRQTAKRKVKFNLVFIINLLIIIIIKRSSLLLISDDILIERQLRKIVSVEVLRVLKDSLDDFRELNHDCSISKSVIHSVNNGHHVSNDYLIISHHRLLHYLSSTSDNA
jgi:hypothetical protein